MTDLLVLGAGLSGLSAALFAARRGARVTLLACGRGSLALSHGCIDVWHASAPPEAMREAVRDCRPPHPYALSGERALRLGLTELTQELGDVGSEYLGSLSSSMRLPTALGTIHMTSLAPASLARGDLDRLGNISLANLEGYRDFYAGLAADGLRSAGLPVDRIVSLPLPAAPVNRDAYATDLARLFDDDSRREQIAEAWLPHLTGISCLGLPAVIGMRRHAEAFADVEQALGISIFEIPTLPPSLPGLRLESALRGACSGRGVDLIEGATVTGPAVSGRDRKRLSGVVAATAGGPRLFNAGRFVLTTGGFLNGGLVAHPDGRLCEAALGLPVDGAGDRSVWTKASMLEPQPYETLGLTVDERLRPLDNTGKPAYRNLHAAGGILAGARRTTEGSRQGIDVASAWRAVECALA